MINEFITDYLGSNSSSATSCIFIRELCENTLQLDNIDTELSELMLVTDENERMAMITAILRIFKRNLKDIYWKYGLNIDTEKAETYSIEKHTAIIETLSEFINMSPATAIGIIPILNSEATDICKMDSIINLLNSDIEPDMIMDILIGVPNKVITTIDGFVNDLVSDLTSGIPESKNLNIVNLLVTNLKAEEITNVASEVTEAMESRDITEYVYRHSKTIIAKYKQKISIVDKTHLLNTVKEALTILILINYIKGNKPVDDSAYILKDIYDDNTVLDNCIVIDEIYKTNNVYTIIDEYLEGINK